MHQTVVREIACDWTVPLLINHKSIFIKNPTGDYNITAYLEPMTYFSWLLTLFFLLSVPFVFYLISRQTQEMDKISIIEAYEATFVSMIMIGSNKNPQKYPTRITFFR